MEGGLWELYERWVILALKVVKGLDFYRRKLTVIDPFEGDLGCLVMVSTMS